MKLSDRTNGTLYLMGKILCFGFLIFSSFCGMGRRKPIQLFYRPPGTEVERYKDDPRLFLNVYPSPSESPIGSVIFIHGGGWAMPGTDLPLFEDWEAPLKSANLRAFSIEHRTTPNVRGREIVEDCIEAIEYVHNHAKRFKIPSEKIAVVGFSSGGHLAVMSALSLSKQNPNLPLKNAAFIKAVVAFYAPLDIRQLAENGTPDIKLILSNYLPVNPGEDEIKTRNMIRPLSDSFLQRAIADISPAENMHPYSPPILLVHGDMDTLVPVWQSIAFYQRSLQIGSQGVQFISVPGAAHNFNQSRKPYAREAEARALQFILAQMQSQ